MFRARKDMLLERSFRNAKIDISTNLGRFLLNKLTELGYGETRVEFYGKEEVFEIWTECGAKKIAEIIHADIERDDVWDVHVWGSHTLNAFPMVWAVYSEHDLFGRPVMTSV